MIYIEPVRNNRNKLYPSCIYQRNKTLPFPIGHFVVPYLGYT